MICSEHNKHVKFISYTGKYPSLCIGELVLEIDGKEYKFSDTYNMKNTFPQFWTSGGFCEITNHSDIYVHSGEWNIDVNAIPAQFKQYESEINEVFNKNVQHGCCGGCI